MNFLVLVRLVRIERRFRPLRNGSNTFSSRKVLVVIRTIPVTRPLPDIAGHVIQAISIRRILRYRRDADASILADVLIWEVPLVRVGHPLSIRLKFSAPHEWLP